MQVGRFGDLKAGDQVDLYLDEELSVMDSDQFEALVEQPLPSKIVPLRARFVYDLRKIDWSHRHAPNTLREMPRHLLMNVLVAMNELGVSVDAFESMSVDAVVDNIRRAARAHGWDTLSHGERLACPDASDEDTDEESGQEDDDEPNGEDDKEPQGEKAAEEGDKEPSADNEDDAEEDEGDEDEDDKEQPSEEVPAAPAGPARKRAAPAAKKAAKPSKP